MLAITALDDVTAYPLCWPAHQARTPPARRAPARFKVDQTTAIQELETELERWGVRDREYLLSTNQRPNSRAVRQLEDTGAALWFYKPQRDRTAPRTLLVFACDRFPGLDHNIRAIGLTLESLRAVERYGAYSMAQAAEGARALPPPDASAPAQRPWWEVLGVQRDAPTAVIDAAYRALLKQRHPDAGGSDRAFQELQDAVAAAKRERADP